MATLKNICLFGWLVILRHQNFKRSTANDLYTQRSTSACEQNFLTDRATSAADKGIEIIVTAITIIDVVNLVISILLKPVRYHQDCSIQNSTISHLPLHKRDIFFVKKNKIEGILTSQDRKFTINMISNDQKMTTQNN